MVLGRAISRLLTYCDFWHPFFVRSLYPCTPANVLLLLPNVSISTILLCLRLREAKVNQALRSQHDSLESTREVHLLERGTIARCGQARRLPLDVRAGP